ncbi:MAG: transcriptional regulator, partial [Solirubrobacterales bacterium]|nr:transcriptional regulator [Solirubrobacterales bacterium]
MTGVNAPAGRSYGGRSGDERAAERRAALVDAAFAFGAREGWRALRIEPLCREAGLNKRYFYESFKDVDEVVAAVLDHLTTDVIAVSTGAIVPGSPGPRAIRDAVRAFVGHLTEDPRR